jgi:hypothetical protein
MKVLTLTLLSISICPLVTAQTIDDGIMLTSKSVQAGHIFTHDQWDEYWEGSVKRVNGNIGRITTDTNASWGAFGLTDRITLFGVVPHVATRPSQGVLQGQRGVQDLMLGGKYSLFERGNGGGQLFRAIVAGSGTFPLSDYNPDFAPLSIGAQSRRMTGRITANFQTSLGVYATGSSSYTVRTNVTLDRPYYYTDDQFFMTNTVEMPDVADYTVSLGLLKYDLNTNVSLTQQSTRGGGDIRRQDMPFLSNRVNFSRVAVMGMYPVPKMRALAFYLSTSRIVEGRNVGRSTSYAVGLLYSRAASGRLIR